MKQILGSVNLEKYIKLFQVKRELGLSRSNFSNPLLIIGQSGIGKSQVVESFAKKEGLAFVKFDLSNVDSATFNGLMITVKDGNNSTHYHTVPSFITKLKTLAEKGKKSVIFLDEVNRSSFDTRNAVFKLVINNEWGVDSKKLSHNIFVIAAMNPNSDEYGDTEELDTAFNKRFVQIEYVPTLSDWMKYAKSKAIHPKVIEILNNNKSFFAYNDPENKKGLDPRTWEDLSYALKACDKIYPGNLEVIYDILEMYAPSFHKKLRMFFTVDNKINVLTVADIAMDVSKNKKPVASNRIQDKYKKTSNPRKLELLKDAIDDMQDGRIKNITMATILKLSPEEILLSVYSPLLSNINESLRAKEIIESTRKIDEIYDLKLFEDILN
jgi:hypothetical protein